MGSIWLRIRGYHPLWRLFPETSARHHDTVSRSYYPTGALLRQWFGLFPVRSPLLGESLLFSLPGGTKMFQFPPLASLPVQRYRIKRWVVPFGNPRVKGYLHLTAAYRSLSRPSSPP